MNLQELGLNNYTDKSRHKYKNLSYLDFYEKHFEKIRNEVKCFVEIGVLNGSSLSTWEQYFPNATIYGIDINPSCKQYEKGRIKIIIGDQNSDEFLNQLKNELPVIDILIDDGSHITAHQIKTFSHLYDKVKEGGFYAIEDLRNSYEEFFNHHDVRKIWPGMMYNDSNDSLKNYRKDFNDWIQEKVKKLDFHQESKLTSIHHYPMIVIFEN